MPFVKLDTGILNSSLWIEKDQRDIFITSLLMAEPREFFDPQPQIEVDTLNLTGFIAPAEWYGFVPAAGVGIANRAGIERQRGIEALRALGSPDPESRSEQFEGRRMIRVNGGYIILNYMDYRDRDHTAAERMRRLRERRKNEYLPFVTPNSDGVTPNSSHMYDISDGVPPNVTQAEDRGQRTEINTSPELTLLSDQTDEIPAIRPEEFGDMWNRLRGALPKITDFTPARKKKVATRMTAGLTLERFQEAIENCRVKPFLAGDNESGWVATFDWLVKNNENIEKAINNPYGLNRKNGGHHANLPAGKTDHNVGLCEELIAEDQYRDRSSENGVMQASKAKQNGPPALLIRS